MPASLACGRGSGRGNDLERRETPGHEKKKKKKKKKKTLTSEPV
jgi:hypothetical protein